MHFHRYFKIMLLLTIALVGVGGLGAQSFFSFFNRHAHKTVKTTIQEKQQERILACAGLSGLSLQEQKAFQAAYAPLVTKQDWLILVDPKHVLPNDYKPNDIVSLSNTDWPKKAQLRKEAMDNMTEMIAEAAKDGVTLIPISTYRSWQYQHGLYQRNLARNGGKPTGYVAQAGESQHHLGTAVDFNTVSPKDENIPALVWLRKHAGEYGFSLSFPKGTDAEKESGYPYEAWHYRYITREAVVLQDNFFDGSQHKTLKFLHNCIFIKSPKNPGLQAE